MKVFKLSLAAALAAGALSSVSAAPLEEAIKDIDVSGFGRYRYESRHEKVKGDNAYTHAQNGEKSWSDNFHRFTLDVNFKATLDDNFFSVIGVRYDTRDVSGSGANKGIANTHGGLKPINANHGNGWGGTSPAGITGDSLSIRQYYVGYKGIPDTTVLAGRQPIGAFFTDDVVGTGLKVLNNSVEGLTLAAVAFDNIEDDGDLAPAAVTDAYGYAISQNNLYGVAGIYSYDWFNAQAWYAHLQNVTNLWAIDLGAKYAIDDAFSVRGRVNVGGGHFTKQMHRAYHPAGQAESNLAKSIMVGVNLGLTYDFLSLDAGYITYGKKDKAGAHTLESNAKFISSGEYVLDYTYFTGKHNVWFGKVGFKYDAYSLGLDYTHDQAKHSSDYSISKVTNNAFTIRAGYKYNDKLNFAAWWELQNKKYKYNVTTMPDRKEDLNRFRFDARYNF